MDSIFSRVIAAAPELASPIDRPLKGPLNQAIPAGQLGTPLDVLMAQRQKAAADLQDLTTNRLAYQKQLGAPGYEQKVLQAEQQAQRAYQAYVAQAKKMGLGMFTE